MTNSPLLLLFALSTFPQTAAPITSVTFSPDAASCVAISQSGLQQYSWPELTLGRTANSQSHNLHCAKFSADGTKLAIGGGDPSEVGRIELFSWPNLKPLATFSDHADSVKAIVWLDDSTLISTSRDRTICIRKIDADKPLAVLKGHSRSVDAACLLQEGKTLITAGADQSVRVWNIETGKLTRSLNQHTQPINALAARPTSEGLPMVASAADDRTLRFWQPTIGRMVRYIRLDKRPLAIAWLDETHIAAACVDGKVRIVNADTVKLVSEHHCLKDWAYSLAVDSTNKSLAVAGAKGEIVRLATSGK